LRCRFYLALLILSVTVTASWERCDFVGSGFNSQLDCLILKKNRFFAAIAKRCCVRGASPLGRSADRRLKPMILYPNFGHPTKSHSSPASFTNLLWGSLVNFYKEDVENPTRNRTSPRPSFLLGKGGLGITYLARDRKGNRVVVKTLKDEVLSSPDLEWYRQKFQQESLRLALFRHQYIVTIVPRLSFCHALVCLENGEQRGPRVPHSPYFLNKVLNNCFGKLRTL